MILTYHQAIELMSYLPMALPALPVNNQTELAQIHQDQSDLQTLILNPEIAVNEEEMLYTRKTA